MCSLTTECVLLLQNVFSYYRMCSLIACRQDLTNVKHREVYEPSLEQSFRALCELEDALRISFAILPFLLLLRKARVNGQLLVPCMNMYKLLLLLLLLLLLWYDYDYDYHL